MSEPAGPLPQPRVRYRRKAAEACRAMKHVTTKVIKQRLLGLSSIWGSFITPTSDAELSKLEEQLPHRSASSVPNDNLKPQLVVEPADEDRQANSLGQPLHSASPAVRATVKWFNPTKGYGFVTITDWSGDALLPSRMLKGIGLDTVEQGDALDVRVQMAAKGLQVTAVIARIAAVDEPPKPPCELQEVGTVKWYDAHKGYGFILRDQGGKDIFVHASALQRSRLAGLKEGQRVVVDVVDHPKGPHAVLLRLA